MKSRETRRVRLGWTAVAVAGLAGAIALGTGCGKSDRLTAPGSRGMGSQSGVPTRSLEMSPPTLAELTTTLGLDAAQAEAVGAALTEWQAAMAPGVDEMPMDGSGHPMPGERDATCWRPPPHERFMEQTAPALRQGQFLGEARMLDQRQEQHLGPGGEADRRPGPGGPMGPVLRRLAYEFSLSLETMGPVGDTFRHGQVAVMRWLREFHHGDLTAEALHDSTALMKSRVARRTSGLLPADAWARLRELLAGARTRWAECRLAGPSESVPLHAERLARLLALTDEQKQQVENLLTGLLPRWTTLLNGVKDGSVPYEDAVTEGARLGRETIEGIRALLTPEQLQRLDAVRPLIRAEIPPVIYF